jgi:hypothetical protein
MGKPKYTQTLDIVAFYFGISENTVFCSNLAARIFKCSFHRTALHFAKNPKQLKSRQS